MDGEFEIKCLQQFGMTSDKIGQILATYKKKQQYAQKYNKEKYYHIRKERHNWKSKSPTSESDKEECIPEEIVTVESPKQDNPQENHE